MKKLFVVTIVLFSILSAKAQNVDVFVKGGIGLSNWIGNDAGGLDPKFSSRVGVGLDVHGKKVWGIRTGLNFAVMGMSFNPDYILSGYSRQDIDCKVNQMYFELPLMTTATVGLNDNVDMVIGFGPYMAAGIGGKTSASVDLDGKYISVGADTFGNEDDGNFDVKRFDLGLGVDFNFEIKRIIFGLDMRFGFIKLVDKRTYETLRFVMNSEVRNFSSCIVVGYRF